MAYVATREVDGQNEPFTEWTHDMRRTAFPLTNFLFPCSRHEIHFRPVRLGRTNALFCPQTPGIAICRCIPIHGQWHAQANTLPRGLRICCLAVYPPTRAVDSGHTGQLVTLAEGSAFRARIVGRPKSHISSIFLNKIASLASRSFSALFTSPRWRPKARPRPASKGAANAGASIRSFHPCHLST